MDRVIEESPFRLDNQEVEKSIVYELPANGNNFTGGSNDKTYTMKK
jgi:hypothetical protein